MIQRDPRPAWSLPHRLARLLLGQVLFAASIALLVRAELGNMPWDVLHEGLSVRLGWSFGTVALVIGALLLVLWLPLRVRPGVGTVTNVLVIPLVVDAALAAVPEAGGTGAAVAMLVGGTLLNAVATALYVGAALGPGPRDGLMTGLVARTGGSVRVVRAGIELAVVGVGWVLGGTLGLGTLAFALVIGPLLGWLMPRMAMPAAAPSPSGPAPRPLRRGARRAPSTSRAGA